MRCRSSSGARSVRANATEFPAFAGTRKGQTSAGRRPAPCAPGRPSPPQSARKIWFAAVDLDGDGPNLNRAERQRRRYTRRAAGSRCSRRLVRAEASRLGTRGVRRCECALSARLAVRREGERARVARVRADAASAEAHSHRSGVLISRGQGAPDAPPARDAPRRLVRAEASPSGTRGVRRSGVLSALVWPFGVKANAPGSRAFARTLRAQKAHSHRRLASTPVEAKAPGCAARARCSSPPRAS
jgi:hypothetical protein